MINEYKSEIIEAEKHVASHHAFIEQRSKRDVKGSMNQQLVAHEEAFQKINCTSCANCCKTTPPVLSISDLDRIPKFLGVRKGNFLKEYVTIDEDGDWVFKNTPCSFLQKDNYCSIYEVRPSGCRTYPQSEMPEFFLQKEALKQNAKVCPITARILNRMNPQL